MKKLLLSVCCAAASTIGMAQTATDFTANDCSGNSHHLFSELNSGKVIVLDWVMPCGSCVSASLTTYNVVQSFQAANPNTVFMYVCDDYANTNCVSLNSWVNTTGLTNTVRFSNAAINMMDYGSTGMPKVVVLGGGTNHTVFYNADNAVNATALQNAIHSAMLSTGLNETAGTVSALHAIPNPASGFMEIRFTLASASDISLELFNLEGQLVSKAFTGKLAAGENKLPLDVTAHAQGTYLLKISAGHVSKFMNVVVRR